MRIRRRKSFHRLFELLRGIEANFDDPVSLDSVRKFNLLLVGEILHSERAIIRHRASQRDINQQLKTGRGTKEASQILRTKLKRVASYIASHEDAIFIWRCFGDALAFLFLDKFSIKHAYFEVDRWGTKEPPGMLTGKTGLRGELSLLIEALEAGVPAILCDATNILRYGDVCLLGASDPRLIEVKSSPKLNKRGKRQIAKLEKLNGFLETDAATDFRGGTGQTLRVSLEVPERNYVSDLNACITRAGVEGQCVIKPEPGITYAAIAGRADHDAIFSGLGGAIVFMLNSDKNDHSWAPYQPFILSIREEAHLLDFIEGRLFLIVCIEPQVLCDLLQRDGWLARYSPDQDYAIQCFHPGSRAYCGLSGQFLARAGYEFASLQWIAEFQLSSSERMKEMSMEGSKDGDPEAHERMLEKLLGPDDEWLRIRS
jgi:hypothetical protein